VTENRGTFIQVLPNKYHYEYLKKIFYVFVIIKNETSCYTENVNPSISYMTSSHQEHLNSSGLQMGQGTSMNRYRSNKHANSGKTSAYSDFNLWNSL